MSKLVGMGNSSSRDENAYQAASGGSDASTGTSASLSSLDHGQERLLKERARYGTVDVLVSSLSNVSRRRNLMDDLVASYTLNSLGGLIHGAAFDPSILTDALDEAGVSRGSLCPNLIPLNDNKAQATVIAHTGEQWHVIPPNISNMMVESDYNNLSSKSPRSPGAGLSSSTRNHSTCVVVGDKNDVGPPREIRLGDRVRLGSVGLLVSSIRYNGQPEQTLPRAAVALHLDNEGVLSAENEGEDMAILAVAEAGSEDKRDSTDAVGEAPHVLPLMVSSPDSREGSGPQESPAPSTPPDSPSLSRDRRSSYPESEADEEGSVQERSYSMCEDCIALGGEVGGEQEPDLRQVRLQGLTRGERFICYMCYETHDSPSDPLVAPCNCRGDTRYVHVKCLQKWYEQTSVPRLANGELALQREDDEGEGDQETDGRYRLAAPQVIRTAVSGALACKICGSAYKTIFQRKSDGKKRNIFMSDEVAPYIVLTVVTNHEANTALHSTRFRVNFTTGDDLPENQPGTGGKVQEVTVGRSGGNDMVLDYRTVSTLHAKIRYHHHYHRGKVEADGERDTGGQMESDCFTIQDCGSSNGTMLHLTEALPLPFGQRVRLRMGRCGISLTPKRNHLAALRYRISKLISNGAVSSVELSALERHKHPFSADDLRCILEKRMVERARMAASTLGLGLPKSSSNDSSPNPRRRLLSLGDGSTPRFRVVRTQPDGSMTPGIAPPRHHVFTGMLARGQLSSLPSDDSYLQGTGGHQQSREADQTSPRAVTGEPFFGLYADSSLSARMRRAQESSHERCKSDGNDDVGGAWIESKQYVEKGEVEQEQEQEQESRGGTSLCRQDSDPGLKLPRVQLSLTSRQKAGGDDEFEFPCPSSARDEISRVGDSISCVDRNSDSFSGSGSLNSGSAGGEK